MTDHQGAVAGLPAGHGIVQRLLGLAVGQVDRLQILEPHHDPLGVRHVRVAAQDRLALGFVDDLLQCVQLEVVDGFPEGHPGHRIDRAIGELQALVGQAGGVEHLDLGAVVQLGEVFLLQSLILGARGGIHLDLDLVDDHVGQRIVVSRRHLHGDVADQGLDLLLGVVVGNFLEPVLLVETALEGRLRGAEAQTPIDHQILPVEVFVAVAGRGAGQAGRPVEVGDHLLECLDPVGGAVLGLGHLIIDNTVERQRGALRDVVGVQRLGQPLQVLVVDQVDVGLLHECARPLIPAADDHAEGQVLQVRPLLRLLPPDQTADADRRDDQDSPQDNHTEQVLDWTTG